MDGTPLNPKHVTEVFLDCLFKEGEETSNFIEAEGIQLTVGFHPERLRSHTAEIEAMLAELPDEFKRSGGGGMSFLYACYDRHGNLWTGMHQTMEQLFLLGIGIGKVNCLLPRPLWSALPGGMPYYVVN